MQKIFLAFPGYQVTLREKIRAIGGFEFWNLEKISEDEFIKLIQERIKPFNKNVRKNYFSTHSEDDYRRAYKKSSWGMLLPNYYRSKDYLEGRWESLFAVNLFSQYDLPVTFCVQRLGISVENTPFEKAQFHSEDKRFQSTKFFKFYKEIFPTLIGVRWQAYDVAKWGREDWRLYAACLLFQGLTKYQKSTQLMTWQAECADIVSFYETLLSRKKNDNGRYKIGQKIEVMLGGHYRKSLTNIQDGLTELFESRNEFVHGSFFERLKTSTKNHPGQPHMAQLPMVDFGFLTTQSKIAKQVMVAYLYLMKKFATKRAGVQKTVPEIIHSGIMDVKMRVKIRRATGEILRLMSFS
jgi:hypothetical protein